MKLLKNLFLFIFLSLTCQIVGQIVIIMSMNFIFGSYNYENWGSLGRASYLVLSIIFASKIYNKIEEII